MVCEVRVWTGPPRARTKVIYADLGYWAISGKKPLGEVKNVEEYLARKKQPPPLGTPQGPGHIPTVGS